MPPEVRVTIIERRSLGSEALLTNPYLVRVSSARDITAFVTFNFFDSDFTVWLELSKYIVINTASCRDDKSGPLDKTVSKVTLCQIAKASLRLALAIVVKLCIY